MPVGTESARSSAYAAMPTRSSSPSTSAAPGRTSAEQAAVDVERDPDVVAHGQRAERLQPLERAADAALRARGAPAAG